MSDFLHCERFHDTDGHCCDGQRYCELAALRGEVARSAPDIRPLMTDIKRAHLAGLMVAMLAIYGWGFYCLEQHLAEAEPAVIAERIP